MIVSSLNAQEELIKASDHLGNIAEAYLEVIPELSHYYSFKKLEAERVLTKKKKDRDIWKRPIIVCPKCGLVLKNKTYVRSTLHFKKVSAMSKKILLVCNLCKHKNDIYLCKKPETINNHPRKNKF